MKRLGEPRVPRHVGQHLLALRLRGAGAIEQVFQIFARGEFARLFGDLLHRELLQIRRQLLVKMRGHDFGGQRAELALFARRGVGIDYRREQHHAVDRNVAVGEVAGQARGARGAVAFAADKERRAPEVVFVQEAADEFAEGGQIVLHSAEVRAVAGLVRAAEARAHGVDEDQVAGIQQAVGIVDVGVRRRRGQAVRLHLHHLGAEGAHVQPDRGRARSAVEQEPDRPLRFVGDAVLGIVDVEQMSLRSRRVVAWRMGMNPTRAVYWMVSLCSVI